MGRTQGGRGDRRVRAAGAGALAWAVWVATGASASPPECYHPRGNLPFGLLGDLNGSGAVNVADAVCAVSASLAALHGQAPPACLAYDPTLADLDCDDQVTVNDVVTLITLVLTGAIPAGLMPDEGGCPAACAPCVPPDGASCFIAQTCVPQMAQQGDACWVCDAASDPAAWTPAPDGLLCEAGSGKRCQLGSCAVVPPDAPAAPSVTAGSAQLQVSFAAPAGDGGAPISSYEVRCTRTGDGATALASGTGTPIAVSSVPGSGAYTCAVRALNSAGAGPYSAESAPVTLTLTPASCLAHFQAGASTSGLYTIDPDGDGPVAPFQVYCDMSSGGGWTLVISQQAGLFVNGMQNYYGLATPQPGNTAVLQYYMQNDWKALASEIRVVRVVGDSYTYQTSHFTGPILIDGPNFVEAADASWRGMIYGNDYPVVTHYQVGQACSSASCRLPAWSATAYSHGMMVTFDWVNNEHTVTLNGTAHFGGNTHIETSWCRRGALLLLR